MLLSDSTSNAIFFCRVLTQAPPPSSTRGGDISVARRMHRVWLHCDQLEQLPFHAIDSLKSAALAGYDQVFWTNQTSAISGCVWNALAEVPRLTPMLIEHSLGDELWQKLEFLLQRGAPPQQIKDIVSMFVVYQFGGSFADLKLFFVPGRSLHERAPQPCLFVGHEPCMQRATYQTLRAEEFLHHRPPVVTADGEFGADAASAPASADTGAGDALVSGSQCLGQAGVVSKRIVPPSAAVGVLGSCHRPS